MPAARTRAVLRSTSATSPSLRLLLLLFCSCRNPGAFAVEDEIERVLHEVGAISDRDYGDLHKVR